MAKRLPLTTLPNPVLRKKAERVDPARIAQSVFQRFLDDMAKTMYEANGVGLAAPQVGVSDQIFLVSTKDGPQVFINATITRYGRKKEEHEGCLSVPGVWGNVQRAIEVDVEGLDQNGKPISLTATGLMAHVIQHEFDHLNGTLFIDKAHHIDDPAQTPA